MNMPSGNSRTRRWKLILAGLVAFLLLAAGAILALRPTGLEPEIAKIRAAGLPVTVEDLNTWYPSVAAQSNAALGVLAASELRNTGNSRSIIMPKHGEAITPQLLDEIRHYVTDNTRALETLHTALQLPESRYPITVSGGTIANGLPNPNLAVIKGLANLLHYETIHLVSAAEVEAAFAPVRDGFALAATLRNEPFLISELLRISFVAIAIRSLECALPSRKFSDEELQQLSEWLARTEVDCSHSLHRAIIGERTIGIRYLGSVMPSLGSPAAEGANFRATIYRGLGFQDRDLRFYLEMMERLSNVMTNSFPAAFEQSMALEQELTQRLSKGLGSFAIFSKGLLPGIVKATEKEAAIVTGLRCAQTAVAVERYRLANGGALPKNLSDLVPKFLPAIPRDAVKGEPLLFEQVPGGYQISSPIAAKLLQNKWNTTFPVVPWKFN